MNNHDLNILFEVQRVLSGKKEPSEELLKTFNDLISRTVKNKSIASERAVKAIQRRRAVFADYATSKKQRAKKNSR